MQRYAHFLVDDEKGVAFLNTDNKVVVPVQESDSCIPYEGIWGDKAGQNVVVGGVCLFDARWQLEFEKIKKNPPARRSLAMPKTREDAFKRIAQGKKVTKIYVPYDLNPDYHVRLIRWQAQKISEIKPRKILYHIPVTEYLVHIKELEDAIGMNVPNIRLILHRLVEKIKIMFVEELCSLGIPTEVEFISPMDLDDEPAKNPDDSYLYPYLHPEKFGVGDRESIIGVEDLSELRISVLAEKKTGKKTSVVCGVLKTPHPYTSKELEGVEVIELLT